MKVTGEVTSEVDFVDGFERRDPDDLKGKMKGQEPAAVTEPEPTAESEAVDDRLNILDNVTAAEPSAVTEPQADLAPAEDVPDWMREMQADAPPIESSASTEPQADLAASMGVLAAVP